MKREDVYHGMTEIRDDLVLDGGKPMEKRRPRRAVWLGAAAAVLAVILGVGLLMNPGGSPLVTTAFALAEPTFPAQVPYPRVEDYRARAEAARTDAELEAISQEYQEALDAWYSAQTQYRGRLDNRADLYPFVERATAQLLSGTNGENRLWSPLNVYLALAMAAETAEGGTRAQLLDLLGAKDIDTLRQTARTVFGNNYCDDGSTLSRLAASVWLRDDGTYNQALMDELAKDYYASSFSGTMGSEEYDRALRDWLDRNTGGKLSDMIRDVSLDPATVMAICTTLDYQACWDIPYDPSDVEERTFHAPNGDKTCEFLTRDGERGYFAGEHFAAVSQRLNTTYGGEFYWILPDEGVSVDELLSDTQVLAFLAGNEGRLAVPCKFVIVHFAAPKFDISANLDLKPTLEALGVIDALDPDKADFSPVTGTENDIFISQVSHGVRLKVDEQGCTGAAFTMIGYAGAAMPEGEAWFTCDRPFLFVLTGSDGLPLFVGVVNEP